MTKRLNKNKIQDKMFDDFEKSLNIFYRRRQKRYFLELKEKIESGSSISIEDYHYREIIRKEAETFMKTRVPELLNFIKEYVDQKLDEIKVQLGANNISKEEANIKFEVLKHLLIAGENEKTK